ncbi:MAG TPA: cyclic nucleotide-binding domain-containing protein [Candidatus Sumerlaeota bacterium]|nr:cyclic nucleotide-binding domain-containing protein [Candidatus Sumerlaeota bacterium]HON50176.1 cyclic nucleotide-binding domain-containing protein [Candidatus Sumerlaeota bacterium]HOR63392.1 cyclic nucleotide-binding domain-containing protein [Candidatus Sumerlaeota bacterium]HPL74143.1 cyclic nucleotide-binding domain-containing protein [Candidatus Sumerlaeota bacterium]HRU53711.1 cyclic nucleotide-binding domain-containing protein [Candidatus Sumerlaeia bacterium]
MMVRFKRVCIIFAITAIVFTGGVLIAAEKAEGLSLSAALAKSDIFKKLNDAERDLLTTASLLRQGKAGEKIIEQNESLDKMFIVMDGECEVWVSGKLITTLKGQLLFGEIEFLDNLPGSADVILLNNSDIIEIEHDKLNRVMEQNPRIGFVIMYEISKIASQRLRAMDAKSATDESKESVLIDKVRLDFISAFNAGDAEVIGKLIDPDAIWMMPNEPVVSGSMNIKAEYIKLFKNVKSKIDLKSGSAQLCGDWAFINGTFSRVDTIFPGGELKKIYGHYLFVLKKQQDGTWLIARDIWNEFVKP